MPAIRLLLLAALTLPTCSVAQDGSNPSADSTAGACNGVLDCHGLELMPELAGGMDAFRARIKYPAAARAAQVEGTVLVRFHVGPDGRPTRLGIVRSPDARLDAEALRVIRESRFEWSALMPEDRRQTDLVQPVSFRLSP